MSGLRAAKTEELVALRDVIASGEAAAPVTKQMLVASGGFASVVACAVAIANLDAVALVALLDAVIAERADRPVAARLVWSGPSSASARAIGTTEALAELCARARQSILLAGYAFDHGERILEPFHNAMTRGVRVEIYLHIDEVRGDDPEEGAKRAVIRFFAKHWTWPERPGIYYDPRTARGNDGAHASMHAKCVIVDERWSLIGSANFTDRGQTRNIEAGALLDDVIFAREALRQFHAARDAEIFTRLW